MADEIKLHNRTLISSPDSDYRVAIGKEGFLTLNMTFAELFVFLKANISYNTLEKDNTVEFTPTGDYNPATKKYVDDEIDSISGVVNWTALTAGTGTTINRSNAAQVGLMVTVTAEFSSSTTTVGSTLLTIPSTISTASLDIDFIAGDRDSEGEEILQLYIPAGTRTIKLREAGNTPNDYSFCVTFPAI